MTSIISFPSSQPKTFCRLALLIGATFFSSIGVANAGLMLTNTSVADEFTISEAGGCAGGCAPLGQTGYVVDTTAPNMVGQATGLYEFTFGHLSRAIATWIAPAALVYRDHPRLCSAAGYRQI